jgi:hypothetical protein
MEFIVLSKYVLDGMCLKFRPEVTECETLLVRVYYVSTRLENIVTVITQSCRWVGVCVGVAEFANHAVASE